MNKKIYAQRIASVFLSLIIGFQNVPLMALAEGDDWIGDDNPSGVAEEFTEENNEALEDEYDSIEAPAENEYRSVSVPFDHLYFNDGLVESIDFSNKRLLVGTDNKSIFTWNTNVISEYDGVYLLSFESEAEAMSAYTYYYDIADFVESDIALSVSGKAASADNGIDALSGLSVLLNSEDGEEDTNYDIALIDTGAEGDLVKSVSVIGGSAGDDNGHGTGMLDAIRSVSPELSVLSIKAFDSRGAGSMSSVYAAMIYAIEKGVDVIDLSFAAKSVTGSAVLDRTVAMAENKGISVVGAAGNDSADVSGYLPGRAAGIYIAGACDEKGRRYFTSNYGDKVFCSAVAETTSEAAAKLSAVIAANGIENTYRELNNGVIFEKDKTHKYKEYTKLVEVPASDGILPGLTGVGVMPVSVFNRGIFPILEEDEENSAPDEEDSSAAGSVTIDYLNLKWLTPSDGEDTSAGSDRLELSPDDEDLSNQQFQINFAVSGQQTHAPGTIEISFPASIWEDRTGAEYGTLTLSVPEEPATGAEFAWRREGDRIIITNIKPIAAASTIMLQGTFRNMKATDIVDGTESEPLQVTVKVQTPEGKVASKTSNAIDASVDTHVEVTNAEKTAYNYTSGSYNVWWEEIPSEMPQELLGALKGANPEDYVYVRWYVSGEAAGSQPFKMYVKDTIADEFGGVMLGVSDCAAGTVVSEDGASIKALLFDGYSTTTKTAYVWTAYKKSEFPENTKDLSVLHNTQTISVEGWDDGPDKNDGYKHEMSVTAEAETRRPITYKVVKEWRDNDNATGNRPKRLGVHIYRKEYSSKKPWESYTMTPDDDYDGDPNTWEYEWTDHGQNSTFSVGETLYDYTGNLYEWFGDESYIKGNWGYYWDSVIQVADNEWRLVNKYYENAIQSDISRVDKKAKSPFDDSNPESKKDGLSLNKLLCSQDVYVPYDITASISAAEDYIADKTPHKFILQDTSYNLQNKSLTTEDIDVGAVTLSKVEAYGYDLENGELVTPKPEEGDSGQGDTYYPSTTASWDTVTLLGRMDDSDDWTPLATLEKDGIWNPINPNIGVSGLGMSARITLPNGISGIRLETEADAAYVLYKCNVEIRLHPTDTIKEMIENAFGDGSETRALFYLENYADIYTEYDDNGQIIVKDETGNSRLYGYNHDTAYLHGRPLKVAAELEKSFVMPEATDEDKILRRIKMHSTLELTQQSNITDRTDYNTALSGGAIPNAASGTYYDLLPYGIDPDLDSIKVSGGDQVIRKYIIRDYKGSGRTLLVVEVQLTDNISYTKPGTDGTGKEISTKYPTDETYPAGGYKNSHILEFDSYVSRDEAYDNNGQLKKYRNVSAFEAGEDEIGNTVNWSGEPDDPTAEKNKQSVDAVGIDSALMTDLDSDSDRSSFVYAGAELKTTNIDYDAMTGLYKRVQAEGTGTWSTGLTGEKSPAVNVQESGLYKYSLTVSSAEGTTTSNIILMDFLENYEPSLNADDEKEEGYGDKQWRGSLVSVELDSPIGLGANPVVYYCTTPVKDITDIEDYYTIKKSDDIAKKLKDTTGTLTKASWTTVKPDDMSTVTAVAIDMRYTGDGEPFKLEDNQRAIVYMNMRAPYDDEPAYLNETDSTDPTKNAHAYNKTYMSCMQTSVNSPDREENLPSNYTKVGIYTKSVEIEKVWDDDNNRDGIRPKKIRVQLLANGEGTGRYLYLDDDNSWKDVFDRLMTYDEYGKYIIYDYEEEFLDDNDDVCDVDYTKSIDRTEWENGYIKLINSHDPEKISIPVTKTWLDDEGDITTRPEYIEVSLYADDNPEREQTFTGKTIKIYPDEDGNWSGEFTDLYKYYDGREIEYSIKETPIEDYIVEGDAESGFAIFNRYYPKGDLVISKTVENTTDESEEHEFEFELALWYGNKEVEGDSGPLTDKYSYSICDSDGKVLKDKDGNDRTGTIGNGDHFFIKGGEHIVIKDIPTHVEIENVRKNVSYLVTEMSASGFELTGVVGDTGSIVSWAAAEAQFTNTYTTRGTAQIAAKKSLTGRTLDPYKFSFSLTDEDGNVITTSRNNANGDVLFGQIPYTNEDAGKTFTYILKEVIPEDAEKVTSDGVVTGYYKDGYTYDPTEYTVKVKVTDNGDGTMKCDVEYFGPDGNSLGFTEIDGKKYPVTPKFNNSYKTEGNVALRAWKTINSGGLSGDAYALKDNQFKFVLYDDKAKETIQIAYNDKKGVIEFLPLKFTQEDVGQTYWYFVREQYDGTQPAAIFNYDERIIGYRITVIDNGDGTLSFNQDSYDMTEAFAKCEDCKGAGTKGGVTCEECHGLGYILTGALSAPENTYLPMFTNGFADGSLSIAKTVTGTNPPAGAEFKFKVKLIGDDIKEEQSFEYTITGNGGERTETAVIDENGEFIITLKGGETALFANNIPAGAAYQISEETPDGWDLIEYTNASGIIEPKATSRASFTNSYDPDMTTAVIIGSKYLDNQPAEEGSFTFVLTEYGKEIERVQVKAGGFIQFDPIKYENTGTHVYEVYEIEGNDTNINYDKHVKTVTVTVTADKSGLHAKVEYEEDGMRFDNYTAPGSLELSKIGVGVNENNNPDFTFKIKFTNENGMPVSGQDIVWYIRDADGTMRDANGNVIGGGTTNNENKEGDENKPETMSASEFFKPITAYSGGMATYAANEIEEDYGISISPDSNYSNVKWSIISTGEKVTVGGNLVDERILQLEPESGNEGMLASWSDATPWSSYAKEITSVRFKKKIYTSYDDNVRLFANCLNLETIDCAGLDTSKTNGSLQYMFAGCSNLTTINFSGMQICKASNVYSLFISCTNLTTINGLDTLIDFTENENNSINMGSMFLQCTSLESVDISGWKTRCSGGIDMTQMFLGCANLAEIKGIEELDTSCVVKLENMFNGCTALTSFDLRKWDVHKVTSFNFLFLNSGITEANLSGWNLESATTISVPFGGDTPIKNLDISHWTIGPSLKSMSGMLSSKTTLESVDMSWWTTGSALTNMGGIFSSCNALTTLDISHWTIGSAFNNNSMNGWFANCNALETINISGWNVGSSLTSMNSFFSSCPNLKNLDMSGWAVGNSFSNVNGLFASTTKLETLDLSGWTGLSPGNLTGSMIFYGAYPSLREITADSVFFSSISAPLTYGKLYTGKWVNIEDLGKPGATSYESAELLEALRSPGAFEKTTFVWYRDCYVIRFEDGGGSGTMPSIYAGCYSDEPYTLPANAFYNPGYVFTGWMDKDDPTKVYPADGNGVAVIPANTYGDQGDVTLVAQWELPENVKWVTYSVEYWQQDINDESLYTKARTIQYKTVQSEGTVTIAIDPEDMKGFITPEPKTVTIVNGVVQGDNPIRFNYDRIRYTIHFEGNGAESGSTPDVKMVANVDKVLRNGFIKDSSAFIEWNTQSDGSGTPYSADVPTSIENAENGATYTLYAQWMDINHSTPTGSYGEMTITCKAGQTIVFLSLPAGTKYEIVEIDIPAGWSQVIAEGSDGVITGGIESNKVSIESVTNRYSATGIANIAAHKMFEGGELVQGAFEFELSANSEFATALEKTITYGDPYGSGESGDYAGEPITIPGAISRKVKITKFTADAGSIDSVLYIYGSEDDSLLIAELTDESDVWEFNIPGSTVRFMANNAAYEAKVTATYKEPMIAFNNDVDQIEFTTDAEGNTIRNPWYGTALAMFDTLTFTEPGTYTFYIREVKGQDPGIIYDSHVEAVTVVVTDNGNGTLSTEVIYSDGIGALFNNHVLNLPETGGMGVGPVAASGAILLGMGVLLILYRRKRKTII